ncbi:unnamed protein product [Prorocentrum cordatum]|uniref:Uncharacterized protein n=1 Tax=Prorocentrum cordatum TaxID=2364126 RepID=A0ABN9XYW4_9DINO|nr:unnamed protein product [Polarella glacialis]
MQTPGSPVRGAIRQQGRNRSSRGRWPRMFAQDHKDLGRAPSRRCWPQVVSNLLDLTCSAAEQCPMEKKKDLSAVVSTSSQSVDLAVDRGCSTFLEVDVSFTELLARNSTAGEIKLDGERLVKWDVVSETSGTATTLDMDVWGPDGQLLTIDASPTEDASAGSEMLLGGAAARMESGQTPEVTGGVQLETVDAAGDRATFQFQAPTSDLSTPFFQPGAGVDFTAASGARLLTDWDASVEAQIWDPSDTDAGVMMTMSVTGSSSGGLFHIRDGDGGKRRQTVDELVYGGNEQF